MFSYFKDNYRVRSINRGGTRRVEIFVTSLVTDPKKYSMSIKEYRNIAVVLGGRSKKHEYDTELELR
jgi:hypothetical protein